MYTKPLAFHCPISSSDIGLLPGTESVCCRQEIYGHQSCSPLRTRSQSCHTSHQLLPPRLEHRLHPSPEEAVQISWLAAEPYMRCRMRLLIYFRL